MFTTSGRNGLQTWNENGEMGFQRIVRVRMFRPSRPATSGYQLLRGSHQCENQRTLLAASSIGLFSHLRQCDDVGEKVPAFGDVISRRERFVTLTCVIESPYWTHSVFNDWFSGIGKEYSWFWRLLQFRYVNRYLQLVLCTMLM